MVRSLVSERSPTIVALPLALLAASLAAIASPIAVAVLAGVTVALATGSSRFGPRHPLERDAPTPIGAAVDAASLSGTDGSVFAERTVLERGFGAFRAASFSDSGGGDDGNGDGAPSSESERTGDSGARSAGDMTRAEARDVLGVSLTADEAEIRAAYRERVKAVHPDNGGDRAAFMRVTAAYERLTG